MGRFGAAGCCAETRASEVTTSATPRMNDTHGRDDLIILMANSVVFFIVQARSVLRPTVLSQATRMSRVISQICAHDCFCNQGLCEGVDICATIRQPSNN